MLAARLIDRVGKGIRGAPRDALVADIAPVDLRGAAFGLRQSLNTVGAFLGPLLAMGPMLLWANDFRAVFWVAIIPGLLAVLVLALGVHGPERSAGAPRVNSVHRDSLRRLTANYWWVVAVGAMFTPARFSEAFLIMRAQQGGLPLALAPLVLIVMSALYALSAYPFGKLADGHSHPILLALGVVLLIAADLMLLIDNHGIALWGGIVLWGLHMGMTQGLLAAMVADTAPEDMRGTAFGCFNFVSGVAVLLASVVAGLLWDRFGAEQTYLAGAARSGSSRSPASRCIGSSLDLYRPTRAAGSFEWPPVRSAFRLAN